MGDYAATANCQAKADVAVNGQTIAKDVPVTYLPFLEKQLVDLHTFIEKLPILDPSERWAYDPTQDFYASEPFQSLRTKKVPKTHIKYEATKEHPAQVEMYMEDVTVGTWTTVKYSGAIPAAKRNAMLERVRKLQDAVKSAREQANSSEVVGANPTATTQTRLNHFGGVAQQQRQDLGLVYHLSNSICADRQIKFPVQYRSIRVQFPSPALFKSKPAGVA